MTFNVRENPLAYRFKFRRWGPDEVQQEFANFHPLPPLLTGPAELADIDKREYTATLDWDERDRWKLLFQCSMFGSRSINRGGAIKQGGRGTANRAGLDPVSQFA